MSTEMLTWDEKIAMYAKFLVVNPHKVVQYIIYAKALGLPKFIYSC